MVPVLQEEKKVAMAYERYIKKNGKLYGPYIYKSIRDEKGNVKNIYVKKAPPAKPTTKIPFEFHSFNVRHNDQAQLRTSREAGRPSAAAPC